MLGSTPVYQSLPFALNSYSYYVLWQERIVGINSPTLYALLVMTKFFCFHFDFRKTPSPVLLVPKEPEKSIERLGKGTKSNKDFKRYMSLVSKSDCEARCNVLYFALFLYIFMLVFPLLDQSQTKLVQKEETST